MIIRVSGNVRQGKTLLISIIGLLFADAGGKVHANFKLDSLNAREITPYDLVKMLRGERRPQTELIVLQEAYAWLSSHRSMSDINEFEAAFVFQSGKLGYDIIYDSQLTSRVEGALRKLANYAFEAEKDEENERFIYWRLDEHDTEHDIRTGESFIIPFALAQLFWNRFDTYTRTQPLGMARLMMKMEALEPALMNAAVDRQLSLIVLQAQETERELPRTTICVKSRLLELGEPVVFADLVCVRLQERQRRRSGFPQGRKTPNTSALGHQLDWSARVKALQNSQ